LLLAMLLASRLLLAMMSLVLLLLATLISLLFRSNSLPLLPVSWSEPSFRGSL
jgi:hypothetical protein